MGIRLGMGIYDGRQEGYTSELASLTQVRNRSLLHGKLQDLKLSI